MPSNQNIDRKINKRLCKREKKRFTSSTTVAPRRVAILQLFFFYLYSNKTKFYRENNERIYKRVINLHINFNYTHKNLKLIEI